MLKKILILVSFVLLTSGVFAFDNLKVHLALTGAAAELYNNQTGEKLSTQQIQWLVQGSQAEDTDPRYINHYYDPRSKINGGLDSDDVIFGVPKHFTGISAKEWAKNQASWVGLTGDYSVGATLENYRLENYNRAYQGVGHIMHLVQDMAVPAHTRNDSHAMGDPFESWAKGFDKPLPGGAVPQELGSLDLAFDGLANYSHNNFYSNDTIDRNIRLEKTIIEKDEFGEDYQYGYVAGYRVVKIKSYKSGDLYSLDSKVYLDYWNLLAPKAIGYSEGVIDYFIKQFKQIDQEKEQENLSLWQKTQNSLAGLWNGAKYTAGDTILAESVQLQEKGATGYALSKLGSGLGLAILDQTADQTAQQAKVAVADALNQTGNALGNAVNQTGQAANQAAVLGQKIINTAAKPLAPNPANAQTIITENPAPLAPAYGTEEATIVVPRNTPNPFPLWIFSNGSGAPLPPPPPSGTPPQAGGENTDATSTPPATTTPADVIAPQLTIISAPAPFISTTSAGFEFSADETPVIFVCRLDNTDWQACEATSTFENLVEGNHLLEAIAIDAANNQSAVASSSWLVDLTAPTATINSLASEYAQTGFDVSWGGEDLPPPPPSGTPPQAGGDNISGLAGFDLEYNINDNLWKPWLTATSATSSIFDQTATSGDAISFRIRATDQAGNTGVWSEAQTKITAVPPTPPPPIDKIVISEIYGGGGNSGAVYKNDFVELYNPTDHAISLDGWSVQYATAAGAFGSSITELVGEIAAHGYFLIQEKAGAGGSADLPIPDASGTIAMAATAGKIKLIKNDLTVMDLVGYGTANEYEGTGPAPAPSNTASIERSGDDTDNNDLDFIVRATPGPQGSIIVPEPSAPIEPAVFCGSQFSGAIFDHSRFVYTQNIETQTFSASNSPYLVQMEPGKGEPLITGELTIEPGTVVKIGGMYFYGWYSWPIIVKVYGKIIARGTPENPIIFTSVYDTDYCDLPYTNPSLWGGTEKNWGGFDFKSGGSIFENAYMHYVGTNSALVPIPSN